nr:hypothetical protein [Tanacetum cinerariifolium]
MVLKPVLKTVEKGTGQREVRPVWINAMRFNHQNFSNSRRNFSPIAVLTKSRIVPISTARQSSSRAAAPVSTAKPINTAAPKPIVNVATTRQNAFQKTHSLSRRPFNQQTALKNRYLVNTANVKSINTTKGKSVTSVVGKQRTNGVKSSACWETSLFSQTIKNMMEDLLLLQAVLKEFYGIKGIKRELSNARTPQQNEVAERKNRTLIEAARTILADSLEPIISFMRPFGCPVTILNTLDHLGKFNGKADKGFLVGYSINSKDFSVYNSRTKKVEENLHVNFLENKTNVVGSKPKWLFDIDSLTNPMNYQPVSAGNRTNGIAGSKIHSDVEQEGKEKVSNQEYILLPVLNTSSDVPSSNEEVVTSLKDVVGKKSTSIDDSENTNSTNSFNTASPTVNTASDKDETFQRTYDEWNFSTPITVNAVGSSFSHPAALDDFSKMPNLEDTGIFDDAYDDRDKKELAIPRQTETGKEFSNPLMDGSLPKTISVKLTNLPEIFNDTYEAPCHTKKVFSNMARKSVHFSGNVTPLFDIMLVQHQAPEGEGSAIPPEPQPIPSTSQQPTSTSVPLNLGANEIVNQEEGDRVERAITTDASLETAQDSDNIIKIQTTTMPNVDIPQGIDTGGSPRCQETMRGTSAQTRSERVLEQPNEPPLTKGHTSGSGERILEENIKLTNIVPTPYDLPLTGGYTLGSDEGRITLAELMETCIKLSNKVTQLENELSTTKAVYNKAFITLTNRVKKLESQLKQKRSKAVIHSSDEEGPSETTEHPRDDDDETLVETLMNIKRSSAKDMRKGIMQETELPKKLKKKEMIQLSLDEELAQKLFAEELAKEEARQKQERYNLEKALELQRQLDQRKENVPKGDQAKEIDWNDLQVLRYHALQNRPFLKPEVKKNMIMYLKNQGGYKQSYFKGMKYEDIRPLFKRIWDQVHTFVPKDSKIEREVMKRAGFDLQQGSLKKQRLDQQTEEIEEKAKAQGDSDQEVEELKLYTRIIHEEDIAIKAIPLAIKPQEDLETLWKLVKDKYGNTRTKEGYERVLWGDLKVMFEPDIKSEVWRQLQGHDVTVWKLFSSCGVHFVRFKNLHIFLLVDKVYPFTSATIKMMLERKLQADQ